MYRRRYAERNANIVLAEAGRDKDFWDWELSVSKYLHQAYRQPIGSRLLQID
jgi:hypothetical protein